MAGDVPNTPALQRPGLQLGPYVTPQPNQRGPSQVCPHNMSTHSSHATRRLFFRYVLQRPAMCGPPYLLADSPIRAMSILQSTLQRASPATPPRQDASMDPYTAPKQAMHTLSLSLSLSNTRAPMHAPQHPDAKRIPELMPGRPACVEASSPPTPTRTRCPPSRLRASWRWGRSSWPAEAHRMGAACIGSVYTTAGLRLTAQPHQTSASPATPMTLQQPAGTQPRLQPLAAGSPATEAPPAPPPRAGGSRRLRPGCPRPRGRRPWPSQRRT
jgi:hypothetical protein